MNDRRILLSPPEMSDVERAALLGAFDSGWVAPAGPELEAFEAELAELTGRRGAVVLSSGTAALHLALMAVGVQRGDDVLVSTLTFGASAFAATYVGARPCFVDCDPATWQMDPLLLAEELQRRATSGRLPSAMAPYTSTAITADGQQLADVCARYEVPLVEDAAEALGARRDGLPGGSYGQVGTLSFNGNKIVTTGGGGALVGDDLDVLQHARYLSTQSRQPVPWYEHRDVGYNYRMGSLNAAVGRGQLQTLPARIDHRRRVREVYETRLGDVARFQDAGSDGHPNWWLPTAQLLTPDVQTEVVVQHLASKGVESRHGFKPMHLQPVFADNPVVGGQVAADHFDRSISLPTGLQVSMEDAAWISDLVLNAIDG